MGEGTTLDWSGRAAGDPLWRIKVTARDGSGASASGTCSALWSGAATDRGAAERRAIDFARRTHAVLSTVATPSLRAYDLCGRAEVVTREAGDQAFEVAIGRAMGAAFGISRRMSEAKAPFNVAVLKATCEAGLRAHARHATLPERACAVIMGFGAWQVGGEGDVLSSSVTDFGISCDQSYVELTATPQIIALQEALAIRAALCEESWRDDAQGTGIDIPGSATLRAAFQESCARSAAQDVETVQRFLTDVGLEREAKAWSALA